MPNKTIDFYNAQAKQYSIETIDLDMSVIRQRFLGLIPKQGHILDLGCGSGRDSRYFLDQDYAITAIDASHELAMLASDFIGQPVRNITFQQLDYKTAFNGIWACASLLHCPKADMQSVLQKLAVALKPDGILYMSFKYGTEERIDERGRFFNDYTETELSMLLLEHPELSVLDLFTEAKPLRNGMQQWVNVFVKKAS